MARIILIRGLYVPYIAKHTGVGNETCKKKVGKKENSSVKVYNCYMRVMRLKDKYILKYCEKGGKYHSWRMVGEVNSFRVFENYECIIYLRYPVLVTSSHLSSLWADGAVQEFRKGRKMWLGREVPLGPRWRRDEERWYILIFFFSTFL